MDPGDYRQRRRLAQEILGQKKIIAETVTDEFIERHPEWLERWSEERVRAYGREDAEFHLDFLAGALELGSPVAFRQYVQWTIGMLESRGISREALLENVEQLKQKLAVHLKEEESSLLDPYFSQAYDSGESSPSTATSELNQVQKVYQQAILNGLREGAMTVLNEALDQGKTLEEIYMLVVQPSLYAVGRLWERAEISVAEEHMATAIAQYTLSRLYEHIEPPEEKVGRVIITGVQGELHQIGANMVADVLEIAGWDVRFLGTNMPHEGILQLVQKLEPDWLGISTTMLFNIDKVRQLIESVRELEDMKKPKIALGGAAFREAPGLSIEMGADTVALSLEELASAFTQPGQR